MFPEGYVFHNGSRQRMGIFDQSVVSTRSFYGRMEMAGIYRYSLTCRQIYNSQPDCHEQVSRVALCSTCILYRNLKQLFTGYYILEHGTIFPI